MWTSRNRGRYDRSRLRYPSDVTRNGRLWSAHSAGQAADGELVGRLSVLVEHYADGGYQGPEFQSAMKRILARVHVEIVKRMRTFRRA